MRRFALVGLILTLTACGGAAVPDDSTGAGVPAPSVAASPEASLAPEPSPIASDLPLPSLPALDPSPATGGVTIGGGGEVAQRAAAFLATQINQPAESLQLQSSEDTEWSDGSLGCPDPATSYIQVITPGRKLVFSDGTRTYDVHTDATGSQVVWCNNGQPTFIGQP